MASKGRHAPSDMTIHRQRIMMLLSKVRDRNGNDGETADSRRPDWARISGERRLVFSRARVEIIPPSGETPEI